MKLPIEKKIDTIRMLQKRMKVIALEHPIAEPPMFHTAAEPFSVLAQEWKKKRELEEITGLKVNCALTRTALKQNWTFPAPPEYMNWIYNENEVGVGVEFCTEKDEVFLGFHFPGNKANESNTSYALLEFNNSWQLLACTLRKVSKQFPIGNNHWFELERRGRQISFGYDPIEDIALLRFSANKPDSFEEHPAVNGVLVLYSGNEPIGYEMVEFSEFYVSGCKIPHFRIPR
jgi:hypothetical protein